MKAPPIPTNHVLHMKRDGERLELELMRFLTLADAKFRRDRPWLRKVEQ